MDKSSFSPIDYVAHMLYCYDRQDAGCTGVRWWCMRWEERQKWRDKALKRIREWRAVEKGCLARTDRDISFRRAHSAEPKS